MLKEALSYPLQAEHRLKTIGIGGLLYFIPVSPIPIAYFTGNRWGENISSFIILIPLLFLAGYSLRVFRSVAHESENLPVFNDWSTMFVDGIKVFLTVIVYQSISYILIYINSNNIVLNNGGPSFIDLFVSHAGLISGLVALFFLPVALTNLALADRFSVIFEFRQIYDAASTDSYFSAVGLWVILGTVFGFIAISLSPLLIGFPLLFYVQVFVIYLLGTGCSPHLLDENDKELVGS